MGLKLLEESIVEHLEQRKAKIRQTDLATDLGLQQNPGEFTRSFVRSVAEKLASENRIGAETIRKPRVSRVYFPVGYNQDQGAV